MKTYAIVCKHCKVQATNITVMPVFNDVGYSAIVGKCNLIPCKFFKTVVDCEVVGEHDVDSDVPPTKSEVIEHYRSLAEEV